jgi:DnaK suppressor protein
MSWPKMDINGLKQGEKHMDAKLLTKYKKLLVEEKQRLLNNSKNALKNELALSPDDLPDETDLAVSEINQNLIFKLRDRERQLLAKIDEALGRIDDGSFGLCKDCEEPIEPRRLEARPVSTLCISCKEKEEHREKIYA